MVLRKAEMCFGSRTPRQDQLPLEMNHISVVSQKFIEEQQQILRLTTPRLKSTPGAPFAQDDSNFCAAYF
jgi:hypothetical protein